MQCVLKFLKSGKKFKKMKFDLKILNKKLINNKNHFITIDGITCSGKTLFAQILKKKLKNSLLISKDIFLLPRTKRIKITRSIGKKLIYTQNSIHYDIAKLKSLIQFLINGNKNNNFTLHNLYNRKNGMNDLTQKFFHNPKKIIIFEGLYSNKDLFKIISPSIKILITENVYASLSRKIERIRDKKISIQNVVNEFTKIHLSSYIKYLKQNHFDYIFTDLKKNFVIAKNGKQKQIKEIKNFLAKHLN